MYLAAAFPGQVKGKRMPIALFLFHFPAIVAGMGYHRDMFTIAAFVGFVEVMLPGAVADCA